MTYYIIKAEFPYLDSDKIKIRPVVILSEPRSKYQSVVCGYLTSKIPEILLDTDVVIEPSKVNGIIIRSLLRLHKLTTLEAEYQGEIIGVLENLEIKKVKEKLKRMFEL